MQGQGEALAGVSVQTALSDAMGNHGFVLPHRQVGQEKESEPRVTDHAGGGTPGQSEGLSTHHHPTTQPARQLRLSGFLDGKDS